LRVDMPAPRHVEHHVTTRLVSMEEKAILILDALRQSARVQFSKLLSGFRERSHGVMTFLAGLELTRRRMLVMRQAKPFAELWIYRRDDESADAAENAVAETAATEGVEE